MRTFSIVAIISLLFGFVPLASAQDQIRVQRGGDNPIYKITINVVERTTTAVNYRHRSGSTPIEFRGTPLLPDAKGEAKVESKQGYMEIDAKFDELQPATRFGPEYLTYVMWAITPEGRPVNLGEVILKGDNSKLEVTNDLQAFGLIVTAEPYFAVTQPSNVVVMENFIRPDTKGKFEQVDAKYELLERGVYTVDVPPAQLKPIRLDKEIPLELYEAKNAVRIARWMGADKDAADTFKKAEGLLTQAEHLRVEGKSYKSTVQAARQAVQTAEDARLIALKRQEETRLAQERARAADRERQAQASAEQARRDVEHAAQLREKAELEQRLEAERRARAEGAREAAEVAAQRARLATAQAEREKQELRIQLNEQLNKILETRDTARGLIINLSDVIFDTGRYTLRPGAREKLAKVAGIVLAHPGLNLEVEGHTDSVGSDDYNQILSEQRANAVRDFLIQQGVNHSLIAARGFGESQPVASNDNAAGRQLNRRVEMVVSGDLIGTPLGATSRLKPQ
jgi:outer membrane protein OmpA-like peptidoglycan-associated protein